MGAIFGIFYRDGQIVQRDTLKSMSDILEHRGDNVQHIWCKNSVGLGYKTLLNSESLSFKNQDGTKIISADCRIDNREVLLKDLNIPKAFYDKLSDSQLILSAY